MVKSATPDSGVGIVAFFADSWNPNVPAVVGVPLIVPSDPRLSPGGRAPLTRLKVYGPGGPAAARLRL